MAGKGHIYSLSAFAIHSVAVSFRHSTAYHKSSASPAPASQRLTFLPPAIPPTVTVRPDPAS